MRRRLVTLSLLPALAAALLTGCGISDPYAGTHAADVDVDELLRRGAVTNADPAPERGGTIPAGARAAQSRLSTGAAQPTPQAALERYAHLYVNWTARQRRRGPARARLPVRGSGARPGAAGRRELRTRPNTRAERRRQQRPPRRHHPEHHDAGAMGPRDLRADHGQGRLLGPSSDAARHLRASHSDPERLGRERMGAAELTCSRTSLRGAEFGRRLQSRTVTPAIWIALAYAVLWIITLLGAVIGTIAPELAPAGRPHPTLHGSIGDLASIAGTNARVLSAPFLLAFFRFPAHRRSRRLGDLLIAGDPRCQRAARRTRARPVARCAFSPTYRSCRSNGWPPPSPRPPG